MRKRLNLGIKQLRSEATLNQEQLRAIGCIAVESTYLETSLEYLIENLCCLDKHDFRVLTAGAQLQTKVNIVRAVTKARLTPEFAQTHKTLFEEISEVCARRNDVIHGRWGVPTLKMVRTENGSFLAREGEPFAVRAKRGEVGHTVFRSKNLMAIARRISDLTLELLAFLNESGLLPPQFVRSVRPPPEVIHARTGTPEEISNLRRRQKDSE